MPILFRAGLTAASARLDSRSVDALLAKIFHSVGGAVTGDFVGLGFFWIGITDDHRGGARLALQTQPDIIEYAFANVVDARAQRFSEGALAHLARLRRRRHSFYLDSRRSLSRSSVSIIHSSCDRVIGGRESSGIEVSFRTAGRDPACVGVPAVGKRVAVGIACFAGNVNALTGEHGTAVRRTGNRWRTVGFCFETNIRAATRRAPAAIVHMKRYRVISHGNSGGKPAHM